MTRGSPPCLAGTFNDWQVDDVRATPVSAHQYEAQIHLSCGRHAFKWVWNGDWRTAWGGRDDDPIVPPLQGRAVSGGGDILLNVLIGGVHRVTLDTQRRRFTAARVDAVPDLAGVFAPQTLLDGSFGAIFRRLRAGGENAPFGYAWHDWARLQPFLEEGAFRGFLPIREGSRILFVFNARLHGPLQMAHDFNDWQPSRDTFSRVEGTDLHYLFTAFPHDGVVRYKLVHGDAWFADPSCRWVEPDGLPVPLFRTGTFNSIIDLGAPTHLRRDALIWVRFPSVLRGRTRDVWISLPRGYSPHDARGYPVLYVNDGNEALTRVGLHQVARRAMDEGTVQPAILVFVGLADAMERNHEYCDLEGREAYAAFLVRELVPFIDATFHTRPTPAARGIAGASFGGISAYYVGWRHPDVFGCVAGQGTSFFAQDGDVLERYAEMPRPRLRLYMDSAAPAYRGGPSDSHASARYARRVLRASGHSVTHIVRRDQRHDWPGWCDRFPEILRAFWPT